METNIHTPLDGFIRVSRWMIGHIALPVGLAMIAGIGVGYITPPSVAMHLKFTIMIGLFWMLYPMMINLRMGKLAELIKLPKQMGTSLMLNFIISPLIIGALVMLFLRSNPAVGAGLMLVGVSPCSAMNTAATAFVRGNVELTLVIIAVSYLLTIVAAPFWVTVFMHKTVPVPFVFMMRQIAFVIIIPMLAGWLTRLLLEKGIGRERYNAIVPSFEGFSFLGVLFMIFFLFVINGRGIITHWEILVMVIGASLAFFGIMMILGIFLPKFLRLNYEDSASITVTSVAKNESIAMALAFMLFGPQAAMGVAIGGVLIQVPFMVAYIQGISKRLRNFYSGEAGSYPEAVPPAAAEPAASLGDEAIAEGVVAPNVVDQEQAVVPTPATAVREIDTYLPRPETLPGQMFLVQIKIETKTEIHGLGVKEQVPAGWEVIPVNDGGAVYYPDEHEWLFMENLPPGTARTITYRVRVPDGTVLGDYEIHGVLSSASPSLTLEITGHTGIKVVSCLPVSWVIARWDTHANRFDIQLGDHIGFDQIRQALNWWIAHQPVPYTCGTALDLAYMEKLAAYWLNSVPVREGDDQQVVSRQPCSKLQDGENG